MCRDEQQDWYHAELRNLTYKKRLSALGLTTLEERRTRGNMIETYKLITNKEDINPNKFFQMSSERGDPELERGHKIFVKSITQKEGRMCSPTG